MVGVKGQCGPYQTVFCALCQSSTALEMNSVFHYCSDGLGKQPLAIVGSPYWMAPEVLRGELYNEKVTLFIFGTAQLAETPTGALFSITTLCNFRNYK